MKHQNYFENKEERAKKAQEWVKKMDSKYKKEIEESIINTAKYPNNTIEKNNNVDKNAPELIFKETDSVSATIDETDGKVCLLNFASYKNPGGMFMNGSKAQEECICHESTLYNVLSEFPEYYNDNKKRLNRALYKNSALYTPDIVFERDGKSYKRDVLTCAAPNYSAAKKYNNVSIKENHEVLKNRIEFVLDCMAFEGVDVPILGAYGCGVFGQDAKEVADTFKTCITENNYPFKKVVFAVISGPNTKPFKDICNNN